MGIDFYAKFNAENRDNVIKAVCETLEISKYTLSVYRDVYAAIQAIPESKNRFDMIYALQTFHYNGAEDVSVLFSLFPGGIDNATELSLGNSRTYRLAVVETSTPDSFWDNDGCFIYVGSVAKKATIREVMGCGYGFPFADALMPYITNIYWS